VLKRHLFDVRLLDEAVKRKRKSFSPLPFLSFVVYSFSVDRHRARGSSNPDARQTFSFLPTAGRI